MANALFKTPVPENEPVKPYAPGSPERAELKAKLAELAGQQIEIPLIIGGKEVRTGDTAEEIIPHDHGHVLATWHKAGDVEVRAAIAAAAEAWKEWSSWPWEDRVAVFLKAAELLAGPWRATANAATMLGQSKTAHQAEIDAACELIDFWRFNAHFVERIYAEQPISGPGVWNRMDHRPLEGFVYAVTPFNFTSIGGNLPTAPAIMGNVALWKPSSKSIYSSYMIMKVLEEAGLPDGVINFIPGDSAQITNCVLAERSFSGLHYTGSTAVFQSLWRQIAEGLPGYAGYPRIVGETGGKNFVLAHPSAEVESLAVALMRGAFEYQGQKCSAVSRAYIPESLWSETEERLLGMVAEAKMGDPTDFTNFMGAVIDGAAFGSIAGYVDYAKASGDSKVLAGGGYDDSKGYFIEPTVVLTENAGQRLMCEEIFGPLLTCYVYPDGKWEEALELIDTGSPYALTGAVFARDRGALEEAERLLRYTAGNYYVNGKPTGAVVGQQPFGGARASGTDDKAGSIFNLLRWVAPRTIKETLVPPRDYRYPYMDAE